MSNNDRLGFKKRAHELFNCEINETFAKNEKHEIILNNVKNSQLILNILTPALSISSVLKNPDLVAATGSLSRHNHRQPIADKIPRDDVQSAMWIPEPFIRRVRDENPL